MRYQYIVITKKRVLRISAKSLAHATRSLKESGIDFLSITEVQE